MRLLEKRRAGRRYASNSRGEAVGLRGAYVRFFEGFRSFQGFLRFFFLWGRFSGVWVFLGLGCLGFRAFGGFGV